MGSKNGQISGPCRAKPVGTTMCVDDTGPERRSNKSINRQMVSEKTVVHSLYAYDWQHGHADYVKICLFAITEL